MKNSVFYSIALILSLITGLFIFKLANIDKTVFTPVMHENDMPAVEVSHEATSEAEPFKAVEKKPLMNKPVSESEVTAREYAKKFNIPKDIEEELIEIIREGKEAAVLPDRRIADKKITKSPPNTDAYLLFGLEKPLLSKRMKNMVSGYSTKTEDFDKMVSACLPEIAYGDSDTATLKAHALSNMGFSALMEDRYEDAEKAFVVLIDNYPYEEVTQITRLEYSRLLLEQGRINEAEQAVNEAMALNSGNKEYTLMANSLKDRIEEYD